MDGLAAAVAHGAKRGLFLLYGLDSANQEFIQSVPVPIIEHCITLG